VHAACGRSLGRPEARPYIATGRCGREYFWLTIWILPPPFFASAILKKLRGCFVEVRILQGLEGFQV
jgi:hypothetical protein